MFPRIVLSFYSLGLTFLAGWLSGLQQYGDLEFYRKAFTNFAVQADSFNSFYQSINLYGNLSDVGYAGLTYAFSRFSNFDFFHFTTNFIFFFLLVHLVTIRGISAQRILLLLLVSLSLYPWALSSNVEKLKLGIAAYFFVLIVIDRFKIALKWSFPLFLIPTLFHASLFLLVIPYYLFPANRLFESDFRTRLAQSRYGIKKTFIRKLFKSRVLRFLVLAMLISTFSWLVFDRIAYYMNRSASDGFSLALFFQALYMGILIFLVRGLSGTKYKFLPASLSIQRLLSHALILLFLILIALLIGLFRINILVFWGIVSMVSLSVDTAPLKRFFAFGSILFAASFLSLLGYISNSLSFGYGYA